MQSLSDTELAGLTPAFKARLEAGETLEDLMPEAFAAVREASSRVLGLRHFDVQIIGGAVLADGQVAEMRTGEGKTLVAILPAYLYALTGKGVHVVTVNDYLAQRDAEWVGKVLQFMGLQVGVVTGGTPGPLRMAQFEADVTYITAYELAFTFLYDNMSSARGVVSKNAGIKRYLRLQAAAGVSGSSRLFFGGCPPDLRLLPASFFPCRPSADPSILLWWTRWTPF